jgi:hypothetical protein
LESAPALNVRKGSYNLAMRRLLVIAAFVLLSLSVQAQMRSAGRGMAGPRAGFGARSAVVNRGPVFTTAWRSGIPFRPFRGPFFPGRLFPGRFHHRGFFLSGAFGFPWFGSSAWYGYPGFYSTYSYPMMGYSYPATSYYYPPLGYSYPLDSSYFANAEDQRRIENRLDRLEERVNRYLDEQYQRSIAAPATRTEPKVEPSPATILVFRDKHSEEVKNYAVVGNTLWVFDEQRARRIPLADLDIGATTRQNEERGVEFRVTK